MSSRRKKVLKNSFLMLIISWYTRILSVFSIIVLTRYLDKQDFGIIAGCFVVQAFFMSLSNVGSETYLIKKNEITENDLNTAWTVNIISKSVVSLIIFFFSGYAAEFMKIPQLESVMKVMCLSSFFMGFKNPALALKVKNLDYSQLIVLNFVSKTISSLISITIAIIYQSYWAVILSDVLYQMIYNIGSHFVIHYKAKFSIKNSCNQWNYSKWVLLRGIINYIRDASDKIIVSRGYSSELLGLYGFSKQSSFMPFNLLVSPLISLLNPSLSDCVNNKKILSEKLSKYICSIGCIYIPVMFSCIYLSDLIVPVVFGSQWGDAIGLFNIFMMATFSGIFSMSLVNIFTLLGEVKILFLVESILSIGFVSFLFAMSNVSLEMFAFFRVVYGYFSIFVLFMVIRLFLPLSIFSYIKLLLPPIVCSIIMICVIHLLSTNLIIDNKYMKLTMFIFMGAVTYILFFVFFVFLLRFRVKEYDFMQQIFLIPVCCVLKKIVQR